MTVVVLDTNGYTALHRGDARVLSALAGASTVFMSVVVVGELHAGFRGGRRRAFNVARLSKFLGGPTVRVLDATSRTAELYGEVKDALRLAGTPIPQNDVWIAAHTIEVGALLITYDRHFRGVAGLRLWSPPAPSS